MIIHVFQLQLAICEEIIFKDDPGLNDTETTAATVTLHILRSHQWRHGYGEIVVDNEFRFAQKFLGPEFYQPLFVDHNDFWCIFRGKLRWCLFSTSTGVSIVNCSILVLKICKYDVTNLIIYDLPYQLCS